MCSVQTLLYMVPITDVNGDTLVQGRFNNYLKIGNTENALKYRNKK